MPWKNVSDSSLHGEVLEEIEVLHPEVPRQLGNKQVGCTGMNRSMDR